MSYTLHREVREGRIVAFISGHTGRRCLSQVPERPLPAQYLDKLLIRPPSFLQHGAKTDTGSNTQRYLCLYPIPPRNVTA